MSYNRNLLIGFAIVAIGLAGVLYYNFFSTRDMDLERAEGIAERYLDSRQFQRGLGTPAN